MKLKFLALSFLASIALLALPARASIVIKDPVTVAITSVSSVTGAYLEIVDLGDQAALSASARDKIAVEISILNNATAPGAARTVTAYYALASVGTYTAAQMATAASSQVMAVENTASVTRVYTLPVIYMSGRYLYLWFDHTARDSGSVLTLTIRVIGLSK